MIERGSGMIRAVVRTEGPLCSAHTRWPVTHGECGHETCWHVMFPLYVMAGMTHTGIRFAGSTS